MGAPLAHAVVVSGKAVARELTFYPLCIWAGLCLFLTSWEQGKWGVVQDGQCRCLTAPTTLPLSHITSPVLVAPRQAGKCGGNTKNKMPPSQPQPSQMILLSSPAPGFGVVEAGRRKGKIASCCQFFPPVHPKRGPLLSPEVPLVWTGVCWREEMVLLTWQNLVKSWKEAVGPSFCGFSEVRFCAPW